MRELVLAALAVYRVSRMLALETGPFQVFKEFRGVVASRLGPEHWVTEGTSCPLCLSFWFALVATLVLRPKGRVKFFLTWWGLAGAATVLYSREVSE